MDKTEFTRRVSACKPMLYRVAMSVLGSLPDAEDAASEAVLRAWTKLDGLRNEAYFETWLTRILINTCRSVLRKRALRSETELTDAVPARESDEKGVYEALMRVELKFRLPLVLHCAEGKTMREIAQSMGLSEGVIKWRIEKGRKRLKEELIKENGYEG